MCLLIFCKWVGLNCLGRRYRGYQSCSSTLAVITGTPTDQLLSSAQAELQKPLPRQWEGNYISSWGKNSSWDQCPFCIFLDMRDVTVALHVRKLEKSPCSKELAAQGNKTGWCVNCWPRLTQATWRVGSWSKTLQLACPSYSIFQWPGDCHLWMHPACHDFSCKQGWGKSCFSQWGRVFSVL